MGSSQSPHPNSNSPSRPSAFQWPVPPVTSNSNTDISVREILERCPDDVLKHVLMAKAEEDKKQTAQDTLKIEQARIHLRQLDLEIMREQSKTSAAIVPPPPQPSYYYSLAPVQQQVLARITGSTEYHPHHTNNIPPLSATAAKEHVYHNQAPVSPIAYPHSAHPLCPPDNNSNNRLNPPRQYLQLPSQQQPTTPISPGGAHDNSNNSNESLRKRGRASISYTTTPATTSEEDKISHNKVMEALKAKIQRGSSSPLATTAPSSAFRDSNNNKRQRTLPKPTNNNSAEAVSPPQPINTNHHQLQQQQPSTPSPRSAKPILPPIDTSIGRIPTTNLPSHPLISPIKSSSPPHPSVSSVRHNNPTTTSVKSEHSL